MTERAARALPVGLACLLALGALLLAAPVPILDEESYLDIAEQLALSRPYDWWRPWQPWGTTQEADAFVFAHPPLHLWWTALVHRAVPELLGVRGLKLAAGAPWALLLGWAAGDLARQTTRRPLLAVGAWIGAPVVLLGIQRGLMPDLGMVALSSAAVAGWRRAVNGSSRAAWLGGLALAAAAWTKYPALALVPVLLLHARHHCGALGAGVRRTAPFWMAALLPLVLGETWLLWTYGRLHPAEVVLRADGISRGFPTVRALGLLTRMAFVALPVVLLLRGLRANLTFGAALGGVAVLLAWRPGQLDVGTALQAWPWAACGAALLIVVVRQLRSPTADRGAGQSGDTLLLGGWALAVVASVLLLHNFAAPRYLFPAALPVALLLVRLIEVRRSGRILMRLAVVLGIVAGLALTAAEHRFFTASATLADRVTQAWASPGAYTGEWSFRWRMRQAGWTFIGSDLPSGTLVIAPTNSSPGPLPEVKERVAGYAYDEIGLRLVCTECRVGLYSDTLGVLPLGWRVGPAEEATAWRIR